MTLITVTVSRWFHPTAVCKSLCVKVLRILRENEPYKKHLGKNVFIKKIKCQQNTLWDSNGLIFGEKIVTFEAHQTQRIQ